MKKFILSLAVLAMGAYSYAQQITIEGIYGGKYRENSLYGVNSLNDGENYTILTKRRIGKTFVRINIEKGSDF